MTHYMTFYEHPRGDHQSKLIKPKGDSYASDVPELKGIKVWRVHTRPVTSFDEMARELKDVAENRPSVYPVRGRLSEAGQRQLSRGLLNRAFKTTTTPTPHLSDEPAHYVMLDIDDLPCPLEIDLSTEEGEQAALKWLLGLLPSYFQGASVWYQWSGSFKYKDPNCLKVHLWFWVERPISSKCLREWMNLLYKRGELRSVMKKGEPKPLTDPTVFRTTQPLYTVNPRFDRSIPEAERHKVIKRCGVIRGEHDSVRLPLEAYAEAQKIKSASRRKSSRPKIHPSNPTPWLGDEEGFSSEAVKRTCLSDYHDLRSLSSGRYAGIYKMACRFGARVRSQHVDERRAREMLQEAARACGACDKHGEAKIYEQIERGLSQGALHASDQREVFNEAGETYRPSTYEETLTETISAIDRGVARAKPSELTLIKIITGAGKSYQALRKSRDLNREGRTVIFAVDTDRALNQARAQLKQIDKDLEPLLKRGELKHCAFYMDQDEPLRSELACIKGERSITRLCHKINNGRRCPYFDTCPLRTGEKDALEGRLILTTHAKIPHLKDLPEDALLIIDESPSLSESDDLKLISLDAMWRESSQDTPSAAWRAEYKSTLGVFARGVSGYLEQLAPDPETLADPQALSREMLLGRFKDQDKALKLAHEVVSMIEAGVDTPALSERAETEAIKMAFKGITDEGYEAELVTRKAIKTLERLAQVIIEDRADMSVSRSPQGEVIIQRRYVMELPALPTVILDATPPVKTWEAYAARRERSVELISAEIKPVKRESYHIKTAVFQGPEMFNEGRLSPRFKERAPRVLKILKKSLQGVPHGSSILVAGSLKFRRLVDATLAGKQTELSGSPLEEILKPYKVKTGHTGKDHRGSNDYEDVSAVIIFGAQRKHYGEHKASLRFLSGESYTDEEINALIQEDEEGTHTQWFGRARGLRRPKDKITYIMIGGRSAPELTGVTWRSFNVLGRDTRQETKEAEMSVENMLKAGREISYRLIESLGVSAKVARGIIKRLKQRYQLSEYTWKMKARGRGVKLWKLAQNNQADQRLNNSALIGTESYHIDPRREEDHIYIYKEQLGQNCHVPDNIEVSPPSSPPQAERQPQRAITHEEVATRRSHQERITHGKLRATAQEVQDRRRATEKQRAERMSQESWGARLTRDEVRWGQQWRQPRELHADRRPRASYQGGYYAIQA